MTESAQRDNAGHGATIATVAFLLGISAMLLLAGFLTFATLSSEPSDSTDDSVSFREQPVEQRSLGQIASQWGELSPVDGSTINFLSGGARPAQVSMALAAAAWFWLAVLLYVVYGLLRRARPRRGVLLGLFVVVWLISDLRWARESISHTAQAYEQFAGKNAEQRALASIDPYLYLYARRIRGRLENETSRLFILHDSDWNDYLRLRLNYHLLPLDIYNYGRYPLPDDLRAGDRLLVIGKIPGLFFRGQDRRLIWTEGELAVEREDIDQLATLYRYLGVPADG